MSSSAASCSLLPVSTVRSWFYRILPTLTPTPTHTHFWERGGRSVSTQAIISLHSRPVSSSNLTCVRQNSRCFSSVYTAGLLYFQSSSRMGQTPSLQKVLGRCLQSDKYKHTRARAHTHRGTRTYAYIHTDTVGDQTARSKGPDGGSS